MGEAKRRKKLGLPPKTKKMTKANNDNFWSKLTFNKLKSQYPAAAFVTTALVLIVLQWKLTLNS